MLVRRPLALMVVMVLLSLAGPSLASFLVSGVDRSPVTRASTTGVDPALLQDLEQSTETVTAIFELGGVPVIEHLTATASSDRVDLSQKSAVDYEASLASEQHDFEAAATAVSPGLRVTAELRRLVNAVSITGPANEIARIAALPGIKRFQLSRQYHALLNQSVPLINAPAAWSQVGGGPFAGRGVKVAILDSGIDLTNPLFADAGFVAPSGFPRGNLSFTNNKVIAARAFLQDQTATPADQNGHGTHVAGIAAGDFNTSTPLGFISGVAPGASLGTYRVLDSAGNGDEAMIVSALEAAFADGFDIASLSFGAPATGTPGILDAAVEVAVVSGMTVVVAAGDDGAKGPMTITSPATALNAISVGASSNSHIVGSVLSVTGPGQVPTALQGVPAFIGATCGPTAPFAIGSATLFDESLLDGKFRGCKLKRLPAGSLAGRVALIERGGNCDLATKINNAAAAGAVATIIYNQDISESPDGGDNLISPDTTGATVPSLFVTRSGGLAIKSWIDANPGATISIFGPAQFSETPDVLAAFSAIGPTLQETLKPDLTAPGENIYSGAIKTCNQQGVSDPTGFISASGTSQAAAHVAGGAAILKQLHPSWTVSQIKSALVNSISAPVLESAGGASSGVLASGTGRLDLGAAASVGATLAPASLSFGTNSLKKLRKGVISVSQTLNITSLIPGVTTFSITADQPAGFTITPSADSLTLAQGQTGQIQINIFANKQAQPGDLTGFVFVSYPKKQSIKAAFWAHF